jgi:hypothetical protein
MSSVHPELNGHQVGSGFEDRLGCFPFFLDCVCDRLCPDNCLSGVWSNVRNATVTSDPRRLRASKLSTEGDRPFKGIESHIQAHNIQYSLEMRHFMMKFSIRPGDFPHVCIQSRFELRIEARAKF